MLEKFESKKLSMYPIEAANYWRVMRQHKLMLLNSATLLDTSNVHFPSSKYSYYRYFLNLRVEAKYWVPIMVINDIDSINDLVDPMVEIKQPDPALVDKIIGSVG